MNLSRILLVILCCAVGATIFTVKKMQATNDVIKTIVPVPTLKPTQAQMVKAGVPGAKLPKFRLEILSPEKSGNYGRLSLDEFLTKGAPSIGIRHLTPENIVRQLPSTDIVIKRPHTNERERVQLEPQPSLDLSSLKIHMAEPINLSYVPEIDNIRFTDRIHDMAESSPLQPGSRDCGTLNHSLKSGPKHSKVRSVGMERQLTERTSVGVEYVYKDGCYKNAIAPIKSLNMPSDDGVNLRVNMRF